MNCLSTHLSRADLVRLIPVHTLLGTSGGMFPTPAQASFSQGCGANASSVAPMPSPGVVPALPNRQGPVTESIHRTQRENRRPRRRFHPPAGAQQALRQCLRRATKRIGLRLWRGGVFTVEGQRKYWAGATVGLGRKGSAKCPPRRGQNICPGRGRGQLEGCTAARCHDIHEYIV